MPIPEWLDPRKIATPQNLKQRILTGINPLKTAIPTSRPGRWLKQANFFNPRNFAERVVTETVGAALRPYLGKETTDELVTRAGFYTMGPYVGAVGNFLHGRPASGALFNPDGTLTEEAKRLERLRPGSIPAGLARGYMDAGSSAVWNPQTKSYEYSGETRRSTTPKQDPVKTYQDFRKRAEELYAQSQQAAKAEEEQSTPPPAPKLPPPASEPPTPELLTVLAKLKGRPGVLNKETGEFTQQPWSATEAERYATYRAPASEEVVVTPSEDQVIEDLKAELLETALTGVGPSEGYESFQSQRLGDAIRQAQEDIIRRRVESGDLMYR